jgi:hypothetical protein
VAKSTQHVLIDVRYVSFGLESGQDQTFILDPYQELWRFSSSKVVLQKGRHLLLGSEGVLGKGEHILLSRISPILTRSFGSQGDGDLIPRADRNRGSSLSSIHSGMVVMEFQLQVMSISEH